MSYANEFIIDRTTYLIEKSGDRIRISKRIGYDEVNYCYLYEDILTEDYYLDMYFCEDDKKLISNTLNNEYDHGLYCLLVEGLERKGILDPYVDYEEYIKKLLDDGMSESDILSSGSDEKHVYNLHFPLDLAQIDFTRITSSILKRIKYGNS